MQKKELHRVKKGTLKSEGLEIPFEFGIIFEIEGVIYTDFYLPDSFDLNASREYLIECSHHKACCVSDGGNSIEIEGLYVKTISPSRGLLEMVCNGSLTFTRDKLPHPDDKENDDTLHYLVLEGLQMEYCEATIYERNSYSEGLLGDKKYLWDRTTIGWSANQSLHNVDFSKIDDDGSVLVSFDNSVNSIQTLTKFNTHRQDFLSILSFLSGAQVKIRKECFGNYFTIGSAEAERETAYSFKKIVNARRNQFIPLNNPYINRSANILSKVMIENFDNFSEWNKKIDLSSIIHYLSGAVQTQTLEEQFFILIIAFERLTTLYAEQTGTQELFCPGKDEYQSIKTELFQVLEKHKITFGKYFDSAKSVIGGLNHVKRMSTKEKMYGIINDTEIALSADLISLIDFVRHKAIHKGDIGQNKEGYKYTILLNELIHELILRLVQYRGPRKSTFLFGRTVLSIDIPISPKIISEKDYTFSKNSVSGH
jgi:hypothetical protein